MKENHENLKKIIFPSHVSDLDQKKCTGLGAGCCSREAIAASFVERFKENQENATYNHAVVIMILHGKTNTAW